MAAIWTASPCWPFSASARVRTRDMMAVGRHRHFAFLAGLRAFLGAPSRPWPFLGAYPAWGPMASAAAASGPRALTAARRLPPLPQARTARRREGQAQDEAVRPCGIRPQRNRSSGEFARACRCPYAVSPASFVLSRARRGTKVMTRSYRWVVYPPTHFEHSRLSHPTPSS
jgi:hypothetical protein